MILEGFRTHFLFGQVRVCARVCVRACGVHAACMRTCARVRVRQCMCSCLGQHVCAYMLARSLMHVHVYEAWQWAQLECPEKCLEPLHRLGAYTKTRDGIDGRSAIAFFLFHQVDMCVSHPVPPVPSRLVPSCPILSCPAPSRARMSVSLCLFCICACVRASLCAHTSVRLCMHAHMHARMHAFVGMCAHVWAVRHTYGVCEWQALTILSQISPSGRIARFLAELFLNQVEELLSLADGSTTPKQLYEVKVNEVAGCCERLELTVSCRRNLSLSPPADF